MAETNLKNYNRNSTAVKRLMRELKEIQLDPSDQYTARPLEDNLFEWHFTIRGPSQTSYEGGIYHGRILFPFEYPFKPPSILVLTPNGRFEINKKICLSISNYHPEFWQPCWSLRTVLVALRAFMPTKAEGAVGSLELTHPQRVKLSKESVTWCCKVCGQANSTALPEEGSLVVGSKAAAEEDAASQICFSVKPEPSTNTSGEPTSPAQQPDVPPISPASNPTPTPTTPATPTTPSTPASKHTNEQETTLPPLALTPTSPTPSAAVPPFSPLTSPSPAAPTPTAITTPTTTVPTTSTTSIKAATTPVATPITTPSATSPPPPPPTTTTTTTTTTTSTSVTTRASSAQASVKDSLVDALLMFVAASLAVAIVAIILEMYQPSSLSQKFFFK